MLSQWLCKIFKSSKIIGYEIEKLSTEIAKHGAEYDLLNPKKAKSLMSCDMLIELHPFNYKNIDEIFKKRFSLTHFIYKINNHASSASSKISQMKDLLALILERKRCAKKLEMVFSMNGKMLQVVKF